MTNILVVGGAGYIGSHTAKLLKNKSYNVIIFDNLSTGFKSLAKYGTFIKGDLTNTKEIDKVFTDNKIDAVFHFAAFSNVGESVLDPQKYYDNNVRNTLNLLASMKKFNIKKIIFSSTCSVFGKPKYLPLDEKHPKNPESPYGNSKFCIEKILSDYDKAYGIKHIILRYFNASGADMDLELGELHQPETHLIPIIFEVLNKKREILNIFGKDYETEDGTCVRDYIHVNDLAIAHLQAYEYLCTKKESDDFNLGSQRGYSILQIKNEIEKQTKKTINFTYKERRQGDVHTLIASSLKAKELLKWETQYSDIENIITSANNWHKKNLN